MRIGKFLDRMDKVYHHHNHHPGGWVFCDLLDYYYGMSAEALFKERYAQSGFLAIPPLAVAMGLLKVSNSRVKWDYSKARRRTPPQSRG